MPTLFKDKCGVFGICGHPDSLSVTRTGLSALQHRGHDSAGVAFIAGEDVKRIVVPGCVNNLPGGLADIRTTMAIGHVRYATCGSADMKNAQPLRLQGRTGGLALAHNGHIVNHRALRLHLRDDDALHSMSDSAVLAENLAMNFDDDLAAALERTLQTVGPAYSLLAMSRNAISAARDPFGVRPLSMGMLSGAMCFASETSALDAVGATYIRDVRPGEIVTINQMGQLATRSLDQRRTAHCIFELIYFARPDSIISGNLVAAFRQRLGERLAVEAPAKDADVIVPVPESGVHAARGFSRVSKLIISDGLQRNEGVPRSFLEPTPLAREDAVAKKMKPVTYLLEGKRIVLIDDSLVRGTTCKQLIALLRQSRVKEIHVRISSPPVLAPCHFGIDTPEEAELFAAGRDVPAMAQALGADSLGFLSTNGLLDSASPAPGFCMGCFTGDYPVPPASATDAHTGKLVNIAKDSHALPGHTSTGTLSVRPHDIL
ncbi:MAG: amidophosphoribosyltransferase [Acidobacteriaceae bacterium]|nr:amidophosphoribosyltransferase [Acidobacteriaceae bacterium]